MGHMNVAWYASKFDEAAWHLFSVMGITIDYTRATSCGMAALEQNIKFLSEARAGELLVVRSRLLEVREKVVKYVHIMYRSDSMEEVASMETVAVHFNLEARKSCPLPQSIIAKCNKLLDEDR